MATDLTNYRQELVGAEERAQADYDKTLLALSGGALGVSFAFVDKLVSPPMVAASLLVSAWVCWVLSLTVVLASHFLSHLAHQKAIQQTDDGTIRTARPGGKASVCLKICNWVGGPVFITGVVLMVIFASRNIGE